MKFLVLFVFVTACAHTQVSKAQVEHREEVAQLAWDFVEKTINDNVMAYGSMIKDSRFLNLVDIELTDDSEAGVVVINVSGEQREFLGRIFIYLFCDPKGVCTIAQVAVKAVSEQQSPPNAQGTSL